MVRHLGSRVIRSRGRRVSRCRPRSPRRTQGWNSHGACGKISPKRSVEWVAPVGQAVPPQNASLRWPLTVRHGTNCSDLAPPLRAAINHRPARARAFARATSGIHLADYASDVVALLEKVGPAIRVGYSMGTRQGSGLTYKSASCSLSTD